MAKLAGFQWDQGNRAKCQKHGLTIKAIEACFAGPIAVFPDADHSQDEVRRRAIGKDHDGRCVFIVFTIREVDGHSYMRPISARYMHAKEVAHYEKENPGL